MRQLKNLENISLFFLGFFLLNYFWSYFVSSSAIAATSNEKNHLIVIFLTKFLGLKIDEVLKAVSAIGMLASLLFSLSFSFRVIKFRPALSLILYSLLALTINFNIYIVQLHYAFICVCLIYLAFFHSENEEENIINVFHSKFHSKHFILLLFFTSFTLSGISKFFFDGWTSGFLFKSIAARENYFFMIPKNAQMIIFQLLSFLVGGLEVLCLPLYLYRKSRFAIWLASLLLHVFIYIGMRNINNISVAMIIIHFFLYDRNLMATRLSTDS